MTYVAEYRLLRKSNVMPPSRRPHWKPFLNTHIRNSCLHMDRQGVWQHDSCTNVSVTLLKGTGPNWSCSCCAHSRTLSCLLKSAHGSPGRTMARNNHCPCIAGTAWRGGEEEQQKRSTRRRRGGGGGRGRRTDKKKMKMSQEKKRLTNEKKR